MIKILLGRRRSQDFHSEVSAIALNDIKFVFYLADCGRFLLNSSKQSGRVTYFVFYKESCRNPAF